MIEHNLTTARLEQRARGLGMRGVIVGKVDGAFFMLARDGVACNVLLGATRADAQRGLYKVRFGDATI